jgi:7-cyano-7-deazaguanine tRNA-ribosyltransferase
VFFINFEVSHKDILGRIGIIKTKRGDLETPHLFPVVNPALQVISPKEIYEEYKCKAIMTNAYLVMKRMKEKAINEGIHRAIGFDGIVATDSGAYQMLVYGKVEVLPDEIVRFEESIGSDIGVILDVPTGYEISKKQAEYTVKETLKNADIALKTIKNKDIIWVGPIQGGIFTDLLAFSAKEMNKKPFSMYALGSPTQIMEQYMFDKLVEMIMVVKMNISIDKPLHLFGAGHPFVFPLAVALGCDTFDSAAYALFAREGRYLTQSGTFKLDELKYFPCSCPVCLTYTPKEVNGFEKAFKEKLLAKHNLYISLEEIKRVKQAIIDGRLWELIEQRARAHPSLLQALLKLEKYKKILEKHSHSTKSKGIFYFGREGLIRPEVLRAKESMLKKYKKPQGANVLVLLPQTNAKPYHENPYIKGIIKKLETTNKVHVCVYAIPYGIIPIEIDDVYPFSQTEMAFPPDIETIQSSIAQTIKYVKRNMYKVLIALIKKDSLGLSLEKSLKRLKKELNIKLIIPYKGSEPFSNKVFKKLEKAIAKYSF